MTLLDNALTNRTSNPPSFNNSEWHVSTQHLDKHKPNGKKKGARQYQTSIITWKNRNAAEEPKFPHETNPVSEMEMKSLSQMK